MSFNQDRPTGNVLASKPSTSFSSISSAASATSAATTRSGGSRLLFGEIDCSSDRSVDSYASVCSFVLCDSSTFLRFWLEDQCRELFLSYVSKRDLANLRLACHDFSVRAAPALFSDLTLSFKANTFTRPARLAALDRIGFYVDKLTIKIPHTPDTFLPPLVDPATGGELNFTYIPQVEPSSSRRPKYGDLATTEILTRQWPTLFHAATNVPAFIRAFSGLVNLSHLTISCPGFDQVQGYRRSTVDYALISIRLAIERNSLNALQTLTLSPIHLGGLLHLSPLLSHGATPRSLSRWSRIHHLNICVDNVPRPVEDQQSQCKLLQTYLTTFRKSLQSLKFQWNFTKGPFPMQQSSSTPHPAGEASRADIQHFDRHRATVAPAIRFPNLERAEFENIETPATEISVFVDAHKLTLTELNFNRTHLFLGSWDDALAPLIKIARKRRSTAIHPPNNNNNDDHAEIPIMLSPTVMAPPRGRLFPAPVLGPMKRVAFVSPLDGSQGGSRKSLRLSGWLAARGVNRRPSAARRVREGLLECEEHFKRVMRGSVLARH